MSSALFFLIAARRCEIAELQQLGRTSALVGTVGQLVHALQKERGLSNVWLGSAGQRAGPARRAQIAVAQAAERAVRTELQALQAGPERLGNGARLFSRVAALIPALDALPALRDRIEAMGTAPAEATSAYVRLVADLLGVVFEAADGATDPQISRWLVAMFNFMQGKEFAGQERACGVAAFTTGHCEEAQRQSWLHLIESQERCFELFTDFADLDVRALWRTQNAEPTPAEIERLRRMGCAAPDVLLNPALTDRWFELCTQRIDAMRRVEEALADGLRALCADKTAQAQAELAHFEALEAPGTAGDSATLPVQAMRTAVQSMAVPEPDAEADGAPAAPTLYGRKLERSVLELAHAQARRLQLMSDELASVRATLHERKVVERAKGLLMAHRRLSEPEAHKMLRQTAMNQNRRLIEVAESVLAMADFLPAR